MNKLATLVILTALVVTLAAFATTVPAFAEGPAASGRTLLDPIVGFTCDWTPIEGTQQVGWPNHVYYRLPYNLGTWTTIYANATNTDDFGFDVYTQYESTLYYTDFDKLPIGSGTKQTYYGLGTLNWAGRLEAGKDSGYFLVDAYNRSAKPVWYQLCSVAK